MCADNPVLDRLEPDAEALIVNRLADPPQHVDRPDRRVLPARRDDQVRAGQGINGGPELTATVDEFFASLRARALVA